MRRQITNLAAFAVATMISVGPLDAQDTRERRQEVEERLRQLRVEMSELERELGRALVRNFSFSTDMPRVLSLTRNRVQLGVLVQTNADRDTDAIGAMLESVTPGSPADEAGLMAGDMITSFNGQSLLGPNPEARADESAPAMRLIELVREIEEGDEVEIQYERDGSSNTVTATLRPLEGGNGFAFVTGSGPDTPFFNVRVAPRVQVRGIPDLEWPGGGESFVTTFFSGVWSDIELVSLNEDLGQYFGTSVGLLVIRAPDDANTELRGGDVILSIDGRSPRSPSRALRILRSYEAGEEMSLEIMRNRERITIDVTVPERAGRFRERREFR